jgi:hypothetical protein
MTRNWEIIKVAKHKIVEVAGGKLAKVEDEANTLWLARPTDCKTPALDNRYFSEKSGAIAYAAQMNAGLGH